MAQDLLLKVGAIGAGVTASCCFTPLPVVAPAALGLGAVAVWLDAALFPLLVFILVLTGVCAIAPMQRPVILASTLTCPRCGGVSVETMPTDACRWFHDRRHCGAALRPLPGDCCVFRSYGDTPCPPKQGDGCC